MRNVLPHTLKFAALRLFLFSLVLAPAFGVVAVQAALPTVSTFGPNHGYATENGTPGTVVTISGINFSGATVVKFSNGLSAGAQVANINAATAGFQIDSDSQIRAIVPPNAVTGKISVTNASGTSSSFDTFTVAPRISTFSPGSGTVGSLVTLNGQNFSAVTAVKFNGTSAGPPVADINAASAGYQIDSAKTIRVRVPVGATTGKISATNSFGDSGLSATDFKILPAISSFTPNHGVATANGKPGTLVTISGSGFTGAIAVKFNDLSAGAPVANITSSVAGFQVDSDTQIRTRVPLNATAGKISVTNASGTANSASSFTVAPLLTSFTPGNGNVGAIVTLNGFNFNSITATDAVRFNGVGAGDKVAGITAAASGYQVFSNTVLKVRVPPNATTGKISVVNSAGDSATSTDTFTVAPRISTFSPGSGTVGSLVTLNGQNFSAVTAVKFNGTSAGPPVADINAASAGYQIDSAKTIRVRVPVGATTGKISATNSFGDSGLSATDFKILPAISGFTPVHGYARVSAKPGTPATPGTVVTITGSSFSGATAVKFNFLSAGPQVADIADPKVIAGYQVVDDSHIKAIVPLYATTGKIIVTTAGGSVLSAGNFTVAPRMGSINPAGGTVGAVVALNGYNFGDVTAVSFNGTDAGPPAADIATVTSGFQIVSSKQINAIVPIGTTTGKVSVTNSFGDSGQSWLTLTVVATQSISGFTPDHGTARTTGVPGTLVTISGTHLDETTAVTFNSLTVGSQVGDIASVPAGFQIVSDTQILARVPAGATSGKIGVDNGVVRTLSVDDFIVDTQGGTLKLPVLFNDNMVLQRDGNVPVWGWAAPGEAIAVSFNGQTKQTVTDTNGRWSVTLDPMAALDSGTLQVQGDTLVIISNVAVGEVWLCSGQSNMVLPVSRTLDVPGTLAGAGDPQLRMFKVGDASTPQVQSDVTGEWFPSEAGSARDFSAAAYFFARELRRELGVPIGLVCSAWNGTHAEAWTSEASLQNDPDLQPILDRWQTIVANDPAEANDPLRPANLYNGMIAPLVPFAMHGVIWYQGEANATRAYQYRKLLPALIGEWRRAWNVAVPQDFPFYLVQLANFKEEKPEPADSDWAELREAQTLTAALDGNGMALAIDTGDTFDIHPIDKQDVGVRLALVARAKTYGQAVEYSGPVFSSMTVEGSELRLKFTHANGLTTTGADPNALPGFAIAGADHKWVWAKARIDGEDIVVSNPAVPQPVAVRYAWADNPAATLYNAAGLPAQPFRTDNWPGLTDNNR